MVEEKKIEYTLEELPIIVDYLYGLFDKCDVFTFTGSLGAGKTTLIRALLRRSGVQGVIASPTFTIVQQYCGEQDRHFYHFDCYRLKSTQEFVSAGFDEYLYEAKSISFIEWPEIIEPLLRNRVCHVALSYASAERREAHIVVSG